MTSIHATHIVGNTVTPRPLLPWAAAGTAVGVPATPIGTTRPKSLAKLAAQINAAHKAGEQATRRGLEYYRRAGELLFLAKRRCGHGMWLKWLAKNVRFGDRQARKYMRLAQQWEQVKSESDSDLSIDEAMRLLTTDPPGDEVAGGAAQPHVARHTGEQEWYTPPEFIEAARHVLGAIDLDPASSAIAQENVRATTYYTKDDDGLSKSWAGRVWLNPPYAPGLVERFVEKLVTHYRTGEVTAAVVLVNNATETLWFRQLADVASAICFPTGRVRFLSPEGEKGAPLQGQAIAYCGEDVGAFEAAFCPLGFCVRVSAITSIVAVLPAAGPEEARR